MAARPLYKKEGGKEYILRFKPVTQLAHWFLLVGMTLSFITGLAMFFKFGEKNILDGLGLALGLPANPTSAQLISWLHDWIGPALMLIGVLIVLAASDKKFGLREITKVGETVNVLTEVAKYRFGRRKDYPPTPFYHPFQVLWVWGVIVGLLLLGISGLFLVLEKWFYMMILPPWWRLFMSWLHIIGAFIFFAALPIHFIMAIFPTNWPMLKSQLLLRGYVEKEWWMAHHKAYAEEAIKKAGGSP
ncbi:cytochrome b/b6 domain-containing protein [Pyrobaculum sp.]|uniref:cytochrome b/b6 domain-containing protein n=1 Tax=Pyrobaculum sp. TaxID=2004705 RepID=UPI003180FC8D